jgi:hypothetical protein
MNCCGGENIDKCIHLGKLDGAVDFGIERIVLCTSSNDNPKCKFLMTALGGITYCRCPAHMAVYALSKEK